MQAADTDVAQYVTQLLLALDLLGVAVFALSGALVAIRSHLDVFRVLVLAYATALAGGVTRDVLIGAIPPQGISDWRYPSLAYTAGAAAVVWHRGIGRLRQPILVPRRGWAGRVRRLRGYTKTSRSVERFLDSSTPRREVFAFQDQPGRVVTRPRPTSLVNTARESSLLGAGGAGCPG